MTEARKKDKPEVEFLPEPEAPSAQLSGAPTPPYAQESEPQPAGLLLLSDRVTTIEEALSGLVHTVSDQQGSLSQLQRQAHDLAALVMSYEARLPLMDEVALSSTPQIAAALEAFFQVVRTDRRFQHDLELAARRMEKVRNGPLTALLQAIVGTQVEDGT